MGTPTSPLHEIPICFVHTHKCDLEEISINCGETATSNIIFQFTKLLTNQNLFLSSNPSSCMAS